ncbi:DUF6233 domain-containing protein [[Kitasatospora] papulosa]|uniref:DUF6233 domain-containing protein n=1 Tax=[Kitasatospora] papulosa TaxID=1464011 RepID=UPI00367EA9BD
MHDDLPPDLPRLRTLEIYLEVSLSRIRERITTLERSELERQRGEKARPPAPDWVLEHGIGVGAPPMEVHVGGCYAAGDRVRPLTREQALTALTDGVDACTHCRPDTALGLL